MIDCNDTLKRIEIKGWVIKYRLVDSSLEGHVLTSNIAGFDSQETAVETLKKFFRSCRPSHVIEVISVEGFYFVPSIDFAPSYVCELFKMPNIREATYAAFKRGETNEPGESLIPADQIRAGAA